MVGAIGSVATTIILMRIYFETVGTTKARLFLQLALANCRDDERRGGQWQVMLWSTDYYRGI